MPAADAALHGFGAFADSTTAEREERTNTMRNELPVDEAFFQRSLRVTEPDVRYTDIREEPFAIHGLYAPQTEPNLKRLPDSVGRAINETAARLYTNPSGGRVRFATDSRYIAVRVRVPYVARRTIMPLLTTAGIDVYAREDGRDVYQTSIRPPRDMTDGYESIAYLPDRRMREVTLYLPLYNDVTSVEIGLQADARLTPAQERARALPVVFYGSSITQGASASRPGMSYPAIAARLLDCDFVNLGFASAARGAMRACASSTAMRFSGNRGGRTAWPTASTRTTWAHTGWRRPSPARWRRNAELLYTARSEEGSRGPEPAAASGGNRQAERRKSQGATLASRLCEFPGLKPLAGSGVEPQAGYGTAVP